jgi:viologen exporter family transport system permease protein
MWAQVRSYTAYRTSFAIDLAVNALVPLLDLAVLLVLFTVTSSLGGFGSAEVLVMFGIAALAFALADLAVGQIEKIRVYVRMGTMDAVLIRPLSVLGQLVSADFALRRLSRVVVAFTILAIALSRARIELTPARLALLVVAPLSGAVLFGSIFVATATVAFWWVDSGEFANGLTYGGRDFTSYPVTVYGQVFRHLFAYGLGFAFVSYYPALVLFGRPDPLGAPEWVGWSSPAVAVLAVLLAGVVWRFGVRRYRSTGS